MRALDALTKLTNFLLAGKLNDVICELVYGASLCALTKKDGNIRPIAIQEIDVKDRVFLSEIGYDKLLNATSNRFWC